MLNEICDSHSTFCCSEGDGIVNTFDLLQLSVAVRYVAGERIVYHVDIFAAFKEKALVVAD
ncbi:MAG: hypothetical protein R3C18_17660 [Planctomycetaceae bacterium]